MSRFASVFAFAAITSATTFAAAEPADFLRITGDGDIPAECDIELTYRDGKTGESYSCIVNSGGTDVAECEFEDEVIRHREDPHSYIWVDITDDTWDDCVEAGGFKVSGTTAYDNSNKKTNVGRYDAPTGSDEEDCLEQFASYNRWESSNYSREFFYHIRMAWERDGEYLQAYRMETKQRNVEDERRIEECVRGVPLLPLDTRVAIKTETKCIDVAAGGSANGTNIQQWSCNASNPNQQFTIESTDTDGVYRIRDLRTDKCLDVSAGGMHDGANIQLWACQSGNANQTFEAFANTSGNREGVSFRNTRTQKCLDVHYASSANGANIQQWPCSEGNRAQVFQVTPL